MKKHKSVNTKSSLINVDVEVISRTNPQHLFTAVVEKADVLCYDHIDGKWTLRFELTLIAPIKPLSNVIRAMTKMIRRLPEAAKHDWNKVSTRMFDIGFESDSNKQVFEDVIGKAEVADIVALGGEIKITIYSNLKEESTT